MKINVQVKDKSWTNYLNKPHLLVKKKVSLLNKRFKNLSKKKILVTLVLSNSKEIKKLNKKFRGKNKSTDIISFPYNERSNLEKDMMNNNIDYLGDIIINIKKVKKKILQIILINSGYTVCCIFLVTLIKMIKTIKRCLN